MPRKELQPFGMLCDVGLQQVHKRRQRRIVVTFECRFDIDAAIIFDPIGDPISLCGFNRRRTPVGTVV